MSKFKDTIAKWLTKLFLSAVLNVVRSILVKAIEVIDRIKQRKDNSGGDKVNHA